MVDCLISALRTGFYPDGRKPLEAIVKEGGRLGSYAAYSLIDADFAIRNDEPGANFVANQKKWMAELEELPGKVHRFGRGRACLVPPGQRQRVQRR